MFIIFGDQIEIGKTLSIIQHCCIIREEDLRVGPSSKRDPAVELSTTAFRAVRS